MQWNTKSNCESQRYNRKLFITQKSLLMSICLRLKHKLCIRKNGYIYVLQVRLAIYKIHKRGLKHKLCIQKNGYIYVL
jgi:hemin uptake protein HemP